MEKTEEWKKFLDGRALTADELTRLTKLIGAPNTVFGLGELAIALARQASYPSKETDAVVSAIEGALVITAYRPLSDKTAAVIETISSAKGDNSLDYLINLELAKLIYGLLPYVTNLTNDLGAKAFDPTLYDLFWQGGFADYVLGFCQSDYSCWVGMLDDAVNYTQIDKMVGLASKMSGKNIGELTKAVRNLQGVFRDKDWEKIAMAIALGDPAYKTLRDLIAQETGATVGKGAAKVGAEGVPEETPTPVASNKEKE